jgi:hypothetical protein
MILYRVNESGGEISTTLLMLSLNKKQQADLVWLKQIAKKLGDMGIYKRKTAV